MKGEMDTGSMFWEENRLKSFKTNWKTLKGYKYCTPENFAEAGFYNSSSKENPDNVQCFACRKQLDGWEKGDDPWKEHKKRGEKCAFVQLRKKNPDDEFKFQEVLQLYNEMRKNILVESSKKYVDTLKYAMELISGLKSGNLDVIEKETS